MRINNRKVALTLAIAGCALILVLSLAGMVAGDIEKFCSGKLAFVAATFVFTSLVLYLIRLLQNFRPTLYWAGNMLLHMGLLIALFSFLGNEVLGEKGLIYVREGTESAVFVDRDGHDRPLPFTVALEDFRVTAYKGTIRVKSYVSSLLIRVPNEKPKKLRLAVNDPIQIGGWRLYQHDYGLHMGPAAQIRLEIKNIFMPDQVAEKIAMKPFVTVSLNDGSKLRVVDFSPTLGFRQNSTPETIKGDAMLNPAYLTAYESIDGWQELHWVLTSDPDSEVFGNLRLHFTDFYGIEYSVISAVRQPFELFLYVGCLLAAAGALGVLVRRSGK